MEQIDPLNKLNNDTIIMRDAYEVIKICQALSMNSESTYTDDLLWHTAVESPQGHTGLNTYNHELLAIFTFLFNISTVLDK